MTATVAEEGLGLALGMIDLSLANSALVHLVEEARLPGASWALRVATSRFLTARRKADQARGGAVARHIRWTAPLAADDIEVVLSALRSRAERISSDESLNWKVRRDARALSERVDSAVAALSKTHKIAESDGGEFIVLD